MAMLRHQPHSFRIADYSLTNDIATSTSTRLHRTSWVYRLPFRRCVPRPTIARITLTRCNSTVRDWHEFQTEAKRCTLLGSESDTRMFDRPPDRPLLIFDGDCSFCRVWVEYWQQITEDRVLYAPYQEVGDCFPDIPRQQFKAAVQLVQPDGKFFGGADAVFRFLALVPGKGSLLWLYEKAPGFAPIADAVYALIARHRSFAYRVTKLLWGIPLESETFSYASWIFLRLLGVIHLIAFLLFGVQAGGIIGSNGISPAGDFLRAASGIFRNCEVLERTHTTLVGQRRCHDPESLRSNLCRLLLLGTKGRYLRVALFVLYLSLVAVGREFMTYQWDALLLEAGFLAIFLGS